MENQEQQRHRSLDLTLVSAQNLKNVNHFSKLQVYAVACLSSDPQTRQRTPTDRHGGENPTWNYTFRFIVPAGTDVAGALAIHVALRTERIFGDRDIGETYIPLKDLVSSSNSANSTVQFASHQVHKPNSRKPRGILNMSYKFGEHVPTRQMSMQEPVTAYPPPPQYGATYGYPQYGYLPQQPIQQGVRNRNNLGMGLGAGLLGGALGGLLIGDMLSDFGAYDVGYDAGGFDGGFW